MQTITNLLASRGYLVRSADAGGGGFSGLIPPESSTHHGGGNTNSGGSDENSHIPLFGQENESSELDEALSFFQDKDEDGNLIDSDEINDLEIEQTELEPIAQERVQALETEIRTAISQMRLPENSIPEDFDVNDRGALNQLLNRTIQSAVGQALNVVFKPVQMAINHQATQFKTMIQNEMSSSNTQRSALDVIRQEVPEYDDPRYTNMIKTIDNGLKSSGKKPAQRAVAIRKILNQMGLKKPTNNGSNRRSTGGNNGNDQNQQVRTGTSALDALFGRQPANTQR